MKRIVLASASPRRLELLRSVGFDVVVAPSGYDERGDDSLTPLELAQRHARGKLDAVIGPSNSALRASVKRTDARASTKLTMGASRYQDAEEAVVFGHDAIVVAADTVVDVDGVALGKPRDAADATRMLKLLSSREHVVHSAFAMRIPNAPSNSGTPRESDAASAAGVVVEESESTRVRFCTLSDADIAAYVATGEPMDKAGAYGIQGRAAALVAGIDGDFYTVMGFPLGRVLRALQRRGIAL